MHLLLFARSFFVCMLFAYTPLCLATTLKIGVFFGNNPSVVSYSAGFAKSKLKEFLINSGSTFAIQNKQIEVIDTGGYYNRSDDGVVYQQAKTLVPKNSGLVVTPNLESNKKVILKITAARANQSGSYDQENMETTITIGLNQWVEIFSDNSLSTINENTVTYSTTNTKGQQSIWIKVGIN